MSDPPRLLPFSTEDWLEFNAQSVRLSCYYKTEEKKFYEVAKPCLLDLSACPMSSEDNKLYTCPMMQRALLVRLYSLVLDLHRHFIPPDVDDPTLLKRIYSDTSNMQPEDITFRDYSLRLLEVARDSLQESYLSTVDLPDEHPWFQAYKKLKFRESPIMINRTTCNKK